MAELREEAIQLLQAGEMRQVQIARRLGVTEAAVSKWRKKLEEDGPQSLELRKATGRPPKLDKDSKEELLKKLVKGSIEAGFKTELWDLESVDEVIQKDFKVTYNKNYIYELLHRLNWRLPRKRKNISSASISVNFEKKELHLQYKNNISECNYDVTIYIEPYMLEGVYYLLANYKKTKGRILDPNNCQDKPIWWPSFLIPDFAKSDRPDPQDRRCKLVAHKRNKIHIN